jgi:hypothetical protein
MAVGHPLPPWTWEEYVHGLPCAYVADLALLRNLSTKAFFADVMHGQLRPPRAVMCSWHHNFDFLQADVLTRRIFELSAMYLAVGDPSGFVLGVVDGGCDRSTSQSRS